MRVGVTNSAGCDADQNFGWTDIWKWNLGVFQRFAELDELNGSHTLYIK